MLRTVLLAAALAVTPVALAAQEPTQVNAAAASRLRASAEAAVAVLRGEEPPAEVFAPAFLAAVPPETLKALETQLAAQYGALTGVESVTPTGPNSANIALRFEKAIGRGPMVLDDQGRIAQLLLNQFDQVDDSPAKILADLAALPGTTSLYYGPLAANAKPILAANADTQMALGSTFKLYVLATLAKQIAAGKHRWDEVIPLNTHSLPSGMAQNWPIGAPVTLQTLATLMISISDNTAADQLIKVVGRDAIAAELRASGHSAPDKTLPFLTTLDLFGLKGDAARGKAYAAASEAEQARLLDAYEAEIAGDPDKIAKPTFSDPTAIDTLEWFANAHDLAGVLRDIAGLKDPTARTIMAVSPGMSAPMRAQWAYAGFKGGSEPGVLNLTWLLQDKAGAWYELTIGWNNPAAPVDENTLEGIARRVLALPRS
jgi:beta-lactamase class A